MLYYSEDNIVEPLSLTDIRMFLSIQNDDQTIDGFLTQTIHQVRSRLEAILPFWLADRTMSIRVPNGKRIGVKGDVSRVVQATEISTMQSPQSSPLE